MQVYVLTPTFLLSSFLGYYANLGSLSTFFTFVTAVSGLSGAWVVRSYPLPPPLSCPSPSKSSLSRPLVDPSSSGLLGVCALVYVQRRLAHLQDDWSGQTDCILPVQERSERKGDQEDLQVVLNDARRERRRV
jgi:hypothetical protein